MTDNNTNPERRAGDPSTFMAMTPPESENDPAPMEATVSAAPAASPSQASAKRPARASEIRAGGIMAQLRDRIKGVVSGQDDDASNHYAGYLSRAVLLEEAPPPRSARATIAIVLGALFLFVIWASVSKLDERTVAEGEILPVNFVQPVQHLEGGIVSEVLVEDGQKVAQGELLILLSKTAPGAELESLRARFAAYSLQVERLSAFALGDAPDFEAAAPGYDDLIADQTRVYNSQLDSRSAQSSVIQSQIAQLTSQQGGLQAQQDALQKEVAFAGEEVALRNDLLEKGLTSRVVYLDAQRQLARAEGQLAEIITGRARIGAEIASARERLLELVERLKIDALTEMGRIAGEREQVGEQLARLEDRVARTSVRAPIPGLVKGLVVTTAGAVIGPGQVLMEIVPIEQELVAEVRISPRDVGHIVAGSEAVVKIVTFNYARYGGIVGKVKQVSATTFKDEEGNPYFRGLISLEQNYVGPDPGLNRITPGMTLVADIKTGEKSLMGYLMRPVYNTLSDSFGER